MLAISQSDGTTPVLRDLLKISVKAGATSSAPSFRILTYISVSEALCSPRSFNSCNTPSSVISTVAIDGNF